MFSMTNSSLKQKLRRKLGKPEVSILIIGCSNPPTRNRVRLLNTHVPTSDFIIDDSLHKLPISERFKFKPNLFEPFEGIFYLIDASKEDMIKHERIFLWEKLFWSESTKNLPIAICSYNSNLQGALSRGELIENLSLIRLTDRNWQIFETPEVSELLEAMNWLKEVIRLGWKKDWMKKEELLEKLAKKRVEIVIEENQQDSQN